MLSDGSIEAAIALAEREWPQLEFRRKSAEEASSSCPLCGQAHEDGFLIFAANGSSSPRYWCRRCNQSGFLDGENRNRSLTQAELTEIRLKRLERQQEEIERRVTAVERLNRSRIHERYHSSLDEQGYEWWCGKGVECWAIREYRLGQCDRCPTDLEHRPSYTIPIMDQGRSKLLNLRHRLAHAENGDKYRPEMAGLGTSLAFPHHLVSADKGIVLEGSIKSLVCGQYDLPTVGVFGKRGRFKVEWLDMFPMDAPIYIGLDPDATESAERLAHGISKTGKETYVIDWPAKPDDMFTMYGCTRDEWLGYVRWARRIH